MIAAVTLFAITLYDYGWHFTYYGLGFTSLICALIYFLLGLAPPPTGLAGKRGLLCSEMRN